MATEWTEVDLRDGLSFTMPDDRTATLLSHGRTPFEWVVLFDDNTGTVLTEEFILDTLNSAAKRKSL